MKTKILATTLIFALSAYASASPSKADQLENSKEAQKDSMVESLVSIANGRNQIASSHIISKHSVTTHSASPLMLSSMKSKNGRNSDLQSFALKELKNTVEMQVALQNL